MQEGDRRRGERNKDTEERGSNKNKREHKNAEGVREERERRTWERKKEGHKGKGKKDTRDVKRTDDDAIITSKLRSSNSLIYSVYI